MLTKEKKILNSEEICDIINMLDKNSGSIRFSERSHLGGLSNVQTTGKDKNFGKQ